MKQANGSGGIIKLSGKRRKPYAVVKTIGWIQKFDDNGIPVGRPIQKRQYLGYYETRKAALKALVNMNDNLPAPAIDTPKTAAFQPFTPTFAQFWQTVRNIKSGIISKSTMVNYDSFFERSEAIHNKRLDAITYMDLQKLISAYAKNGKTIGSLRLYKSYLSMLFNQAIKMQYITTNYAQYIELRPTKETSEKKALPHEVIKKIYNSSTKSRDLLLILIYTGMRITELLTVKEIHEGYMISGIKTTSGKNRMIPIHPQIQNEVKRFAASKKLIYAAYRERLLKDCEVYGYDFTLHECRHTFVTLANEYGMTPLSVKLIVGHSTGQNVTESVYTHVKLATLQKEISKIPMVKDL